MSQEIESLTTDISSRRTGSGVSPMWFAFAVLALVLALYAHWRFGQFDERIDRIRGHIGDLRASQERLGADLGALAAKLDESNERLRTEVRHLREVPAQVGELGQTVAELRARTEAPQRAWVRAEALYLLELAARRLRLEHDVPTAIAAMESADARLATVTDPAVGEVRAQLARELAALRAVDVPNVPALVTRLRMLESHASTFRVRGVAMSNLRREGTELRSADDEGAVARALARLRAATRDLLSYQRVDPAASRLVTQEEEYLRRQHLELLLFSARIAAMQQDGHAYVESLRSADEWLERHFDGSDPSVRTARAEIELLADIDVDPATPEVGAAAVLLQRVIGAGRPQAAGG
jgi:uroporphyrin-III C-methyltransferase